jgi:hypothetical protein
MLQAVWPHAQHILVNVGTPGHGAASLVHDLCIDSIVPAFAHIVFAELCTVGAHEKDWVCPALLP